MNTPIAPSWQGKMLGRYRMMRLLGRGGMGEVWLAEDTQLRRQIAIKLLPAAFARDQQFLQAFEREARAAAALDHPHILPIHDFGQEHIGPDMLATYLVMPYITDGSLRDRMRTVNAPFPPAEALPYLKQAAQAIDYAHSRQILHRDIKPANMLLQQNWLFLADLGIARLLASTTRQTQTQHTVGTPGFMAPEQIRGHAEAASDRYSLAVTAYVLFTGRPPFTGETSYSILLKQMQQNPPLPREFNPELTLLTQQVLLWGLAKRPEDRPPSCMAFVQALEQSFQSRIASSSDGAEGTTLLAPWRQYQQEALSGQQAFISPAPAPSPTRPMPGAGDVLAVQETVLPDQERFPDHQETQPASSTPPTLPAKSRIVRRSLLIGAGVGITALAGLGVGGYEWYRHLPATPRTVVKSPPGPHKLVSGRPVLTLKGHSSSVISVAWDPTGRYLASVGDDTYLMLWDIGNLVPANSSGMKTVTTPLRKWKIATPTNDAFLFTQDWLSWSSDGQMLSIIIQDNEIRLFDAFRNANAPHIYQNTSANTPPAYVNLAWSPRANSFATYDINDDLSPTLHVDLWKTTSPTHPAQTLLFRNTPADTTNPGISVLAWSADGSLLAGHTNSGTVIVWNVATGEVKQVLSLPRRSGPPLINNECLTWSPTDPYRLVASDFDLATVWDVQQHKQLLTLTLHESGFTPLYVWGMSWAPNGQYLAMCYPRNPRIYVWDVRTTGTDAGRETTRAQLLSFPAPQAYGYSGSVHDVAWSPDGRYIASAGGDDLVIVWQVDAG